MRAVLASACLFAVACGQSPSLRGQAIGCALGGARAIAADCTLETRGPGLVIVHHPNGGFRRFSMADGTIHAADGGERAQVAAVGDVMRIAIGTDRYEIPSALVWGVTRD